MQSTAGDIAGGGGGGIFSTERGRAGVGVGGAGLSRFRSAPATWLDALLDDDLTRDDPLRFGPDNNTNHSHSGSLTQLLASGTTTTRTNPSPPPASSSLARSNSTSSYNIPATAPATANAHDPAGFFDPPSDGGAGSATGQLSHASGLDSFYRMNSSPADFLSGSVDGYFSSFGGFSSNYELMGATQVNNISPSGKRMREGTDNELHSPSKLSSSPLKREHSSGASSLLDIEMDKLFEDSVPCRVRAKRGCATHPRSIAERVRRTKISDRIRRLQELVPNMDKQTNTADMLEEAVEYVKVLQKQIEDLTENQKRCTCAAKNHHLL